MGVQHRGVRQPACRCVADDRRGFFFSDDGYLEGIQDSDYGEEEDEDGRTEIIYSVSEVGDMVDFLKQFPFITMEYYKWGLSVPMIRIMTADNTRVRYLSEKQAEERKKRKGMKKINGKEDMTDLGIPMLGFEDDSQSNVEQ